MSLKLICLIGLMAIALCMTTALAQDSSIRVIGVGTVQVPADTVIIAVSAQNDNENATLAATRNSELLNKTEKSLIDAGVKREEIMADRSKGYLSYHQVICNTTNNTTSCRDVVTHVAIEQVTIKLKTIDENQTQKVIDTAKSTGADAAIRGYSLSDSSKAVSEARKKALDNAKAKAEDYASSLGFSLGKAVEIEEPTDPEIEIGPTHGWEMPREMNHMFWREPSLRMDRFLEADYIPEGMAEVTAYVSVTYKV